MVPLAPVAAPDERYEQQSRTVEVSGSPAVPIEVFCSAAAVRASTICSNQQRSDLKLPVRAQLSLAYRGDGGRVIVVLSKREKLEMEAMFRRTIPEEARYGSTFVFRQARSPSLPQATCNRCKIISHTDGYGSAF